MTTEELTEMFFNSTPEDYIKAFTKSCEKNPVVSIKEYSIKQQIVIDAIKSQYKVANVAFCGKTKVRVTLSDKTYIDILKNGYAWHRLDVYTTIKDFEYSLCGGK